MNRFSTDRLIEAWAALGPIMEIRNQQSYDRAVSALDTLPDQIGDDERHPL